MNARSEPRGWLVCDREICIYNEEARPGSRPLLRCIKHGAILTPRYYLRHARTRQEARAEVDAARGTWRLK